MPEVIVVGGGPAGSYTAGLLAEAGHRVTVFEARDEIGHKASCTGIVGRECVERFGIDESLILRRAKSARLFSPSGREIHVEREDTQACILDRGGFDKWLAERASSAGAGYEMNCRVSGIRVDDGGVRLDVSYKGSQKTVTAEVVVLACSFERKLHDELKLGYGDYVAGAQVEVSTREVTEVEVYFGKDIAPGFFAWLVPVSDDRARLGLLSRHKPDMYLNKLLDSLEAQGRVVSPESGFAHGAIPLKPPRRTYGQRLLLVGDAAGQTKPTTGGGIYYGLLGATAAAATLETALASGDYSRQALSAYETRWKGILGQEMKSGRRARRIFEALSDDLLDRAFHTVSSRGLDRQLLANDELTFDWHSGALKQLLQDRAIKKTLWFFRRR